MLGLGSTIAVSVGQTGKAGDVLLSIEAIKMEAAHHADRDGSVAELFIRQSIRSTRKIC